MRTTYTGWVPCSVFDSEKPIKRVSITTTGRQKFYIELEKEDDKAYYLLESYGPGATQHILYKDPADAAIVYLKNFKATANNMLYNITTFLGA